MEIVAALFVLMTILDAISKSKKKKAELARLQADEKAIAQDAVMKPSEVVPETGRPPVSSHVEEPSVAVSPPLGRDGRRKEAPRAAERVATGRVEAAHAVARAKDQMEEYGGAFKTAMRAHNPVLSMVFDEVLKDDDPPDAKSDPAVDPVRSSLPEPLPRKGDLPSVAQIAGEVRPPVAEELPHERPERSLRLDTRRPVPKPAQVNAPGRVGSIGEAMDIRDLLRNQGADGLRRAVILREVLGSPVGARISTRR